MPYLPTQQEMLKLKCMEYMLHANQFMDSLVQVLYAAKGLKYFRVLQKLFFILTALQTPTPSCTQQMQNEVKAYERTIKDKELVEVHDENAVIAFAATLHLLLW